MGFVMKMDRGALCQVIINFVVFRSVLLKHFLVHRRVKLEHAIGGKSGEFYHRIEKLVIT